MFPKRTTRVFCLMYYRLCLDVIKRIVAAKRCAKSTRAAATMFGVSSATVSYWWRHGAPKASKKAGKTQKRRLEAHVDRRRAKVKRLLTASPLCTANDLKRELYKLHVKVSKSTVLRDIKSLGYRSRVRPRVCVLPADEPKRLIFCKKWAKKTGTARKIVWSDEKVFTSNDEGTRRMWVRPNERPNVRRCVRWPSGRVIVWGCIGLNYRKLIILPQNARINQQDYVRRILSRCVPSIKALGCIFQQDGAPCHRGSNTMRYLANSGVSLLDGFPARSPDLSPIESLWSVLARRVASHCCSTREELVAAIQHEWDGLDRELIRSLVLSFPNRCERVIQRNGAMQ